MPTCGGAVCTVTAMGRYGTCFSVTVEWQLAPCLVRGVTRMRTAASRPLRRLLGEQLFGASAEGTSLLEIRSVRLASGQKMGWPHFGLLAVQRCKKGAAVGVRKKHGIRSVGTGRLHLSRQGGRCSYSACLHVAQIPSCFYAFGCFQPEFNKAPDRFVFRWQTLIKTEVGNAFCLLLSEVHQLFYRENGLFAH